MVEIGVLDAMKKATAFAALSVIKLGTQTSYPSVEEVEAFFQTIV
ncbi:hypothetical protein [Fictibacillus sp. WQ 8-8]|nr:hypothetical protein [Fictibacillus sp. WQ 8-8]